MKKALFSMLIVLLTVAVSCNRRQNTNKPLLTPSSSGNPYEVMVVAEDSIWDGYAGRALRRVLNKPVPMLPQDEPSFHVTRIRPKNYDRIMNLFRNIIVFKIDDDFRQGKIKFERNVFAYPQAIVTIHAPNTRVASSYITENTTSIIDFFYNEELNRQVESLNFSYNPIFSDSLKKVLGCDMLIPPDIAKMKIGKDFIWASNDGLQTVQNIVVYAYPYSTQKVFDKHSFIALRDTFMGRNIPGYNPGSVMQTNPECVDVRNYTQNGQFIQEARGLWEMSGDAMGGPFVSQSRVDSVNNRVIVTEAFVYAPSKMKRSMIRRLEASLYTLRMNVKEK
ncbi:MAG: DUF4837 family protein [Bacteroidaceae bacterium]|nr:DUF4837 family protein [Bacteroidaceae bacterium]